ncbi:MAG: SpoIID/LytB domain-containing protein [Proteobacteria bacterium]|nr:SpoIID/LytB domain-containing protein [Pseudomonadota bacterium]
MRKIASIALAAAMIFMSQASQALPPPGIRVLILESQRIEVKGVGTPLALSSGDAHMAKPGPARQSAIMTAGPRGLIFEGTEIGTAASLKNRTERYEIDGKIFRGEIRVIWKSAGVLIAVNHLPLEEYLVGLVGSEMYPGWPIEAYKAQAVAARTYALHHADKAAKARDYDVTATVLSQVYEGVGREAESARQAVDATRGMVLMRGGAVFPSYYHSCCGGLTEHAHNVWDGAWGPPQVEDRFCERSPKRSWSEKIPLTEFRQKLEKNGIRVGTLQGVSIRPEMDSPRVDQMIVEHDGGIDAIRATDIRSMFGYSRIRSTWFDVKLEGNAISFVGRGYGHGVGMCQWGAKGMADQGSAYEQILRFYYADAEIRRAY